MKILLINDGASRCNWGDRAAAVAVRAMISTLGGEVFQSISERDIDKSSFFGPPPDFVDLESGTDGWVENDEAVRTAHRASGAAQDCQESGGISRARVIPSEWDDFEASARIVIGKRNPGQSCLEQSKAVTWRLFMVAVRWRAAGLCRARCCFSAT